MVKQSRLTLILVLLLTCLPVYSGSLTPLKIGIAPNGDDVVSMAKLWIPFLEKIEANSGIKLRFATAPDLLEFNHRLSKGEYDLVVTDQYLFTIFSQKHNLSFLAELARGQESTEMALVAASGIERTEQLKGTLLAIREDEKTRNVQSLDDYLASKGVTALRDSLPSYDKILESIGQELHLAGLVPLQMAKQVDQNFNILWRAQNKHSYVMTTPPDISPETVEKLAASLRALSEQQKDTDQQEVKVLSVKQVSKVSTDAD